ncbi:MAG TPA: hypothetical protein VN766_20280 [Stellaceae bacterium]|jgi:hypothetical protein|nr:hypothetical protein [Stellaceae bacterium]
MEQKLYVGNAEPALSDILNDPIVRLVMLRDGVRAEDLDKLVAQARDYLLTRSPESQAAA